MTVRVLLRMTALQINVQRAKLAKRLCPAVILARCHNLGMKIIVQTHSARQGFLKCPLPILVASVKLVQPMPGKNAFCVGINHEKGALSRVKQNGIRRFRSDEARKISFR